MNLEQTYQRNLKRLLEDNTICYENRKLFRKYFEWEEYKLKRCNSLNRLDAACYKTLLAYTSRLRTVNKWFCNVPWKTLKKEDIKRVYDDLEDGKILSNSGEPFKDRTTYYNKIFKSKPFDLAGKANLAKKVIEFYRPVDEEVRFIVEENIRNLIDVMINVRHKALAWLAFDYGDNINTLLQLKKSDFVRQYNTDTKAAEYRLNFRREILKRSRRVRSEISNYNETVTFLDIILKDLNNDDNLFTFSYGMAVKILRRAVRITGIKCAPRGQKPTWKDFRSSMACDLLSKGWTTDEVNARLGHKPSSREIDKYVSFLAIDKNRPKQKIHDNTVDKLKQELEQARENQKLQAMRTMELQEEMIQLKKLLALRGLR